jgi:hypothetical protein
MIKATQSNVFIRFICGLFYALGIQPNTLISPQYKTRTIDNRYS